jgi:hypothetical protein
MKRKSVRFLLILLLAGFSAVVIANGYNSHPRPLMGYASGEAHGVVDQKCDPINSDPANGIPGVATVSSMTGEVSHFGWAEYSSSHCTTPDAQHSLLGEASLVAANGDEISLLYTTDLISPFMIPGTLVYRAEYVVVGGTGRFENASGEIVGLVFVTIENPTDPWIPVDQEFTGQITY